MRNLSVLFILISAMAFTGCSGAAADPMPVTRDAPETASAPVAAPKVKTPENPNGYEVTVYKSPTCGCCGMWEDHLVKNGFKVTPKPVDDMRNVRDEFGVPDALGSCHTGIVEGYIVEGHVPADDVLKMLKERPKIAGLTAPGMPSKSPGMQPEGLEPRGYDVLSFDEKGKTEVFTSYRK